MTTCRVPLQFGSPVRWVGVRELRGTDESAIEGTDTAAAISLLDRLLVQFSIRSVTPCSPAQLTAADRDRVLAAVYTTTFGDQVESTVECSECREPFDLNFNLMDFIASQDASIDRAAVSPDGDGVFLAGGKLKFRLPTGEDECAVIGLTAEAAVRELGRRCLLEGDPDQDLSDLEAAMEGAGPTLNAELEAVCPECNAAQTISFDLQEFVLQRLLNEQKRLTGEVDALARLYGWSLGEILDLPRTQRRRYVELAESR